MHVTGLASLLEFPAVVGAIQLLVFTVAWLAVGVYIWDQVEVLFSWLT